MKGEGIVLLLLVAVGGYFLYQSSQKPATTTGTGLGATQPGFGVNFGFTKFGN